MTTSKVAKLFEETESRKKKEIIKEQAENVMFRYSVNIKGK